MGKNGKEVIETATPSGEKKKRVIQRSSSSSEEDDDGSPIRHILCVKKEVDVKHFEQLEDCFILDFDPSQSIQLSKLSVSEFDNVASDNDASPDLAVVSEKGQVACRDYPHSRHLCLKFPFETTPHESYCELCYCYVCDSAAPCKSWSSWTMPLMAHCHASEHMEDWKSKRRDLRKQERAANTLFK